MIQRGKIIVGNWKMNLNVAEASLLVHRLGERIRIRRDIEVVLGPTLLALQPISLQLDRRKFRLAAQNAYFQDQGAFTGEVSFSMLQDLVHYVIVGHSERRYKFGEGLGVVRDKVAAALRNDISPILCVGETKQERMDHETNLVLHDQIMTGLANVTSEEIERVVFAYEPIWALSNGTDFLRHDTANAETISLAVQTIRRNIFDLYGKKAADSARIMYGGSVSSKNAAEILAVDGIDGALVGGASLNYTEFAGIVEAAYNQLQTEKQATTSQAWPEPEQNSKPTKKDA